MVSKIHDQLVNWNETLPLIERSCARVKREHVVKWVI